MKPNQIVLFKEWDNDPLTQVGVTAGMHGTRVLVSHVPKGRLGTKTLTLDPSLITELTEGQADTWFCHYQDIYNLLKTTVR